MRYLLKQKIFSLADTFHIKNEAGEDVFLVKGAVLSFGHQLTFYDLAGNELAFIRQKLLSWGPTYEIYRGGELFAVVKKQLFSFFKHVFYVDVPGPDDLIAEGDFWDLEFTFSRGEKPSPPSPDNGSPGQTPTASTSPKAKTTSSSSPAL